MHLISSILFAFSANIDTFIIGLSYGIKKSHIPLAENVVISLITFAGTILSIHLGLQIVMFIPADVSQAFGSIILIVLGIYYVLKSALQYKSSKALSKNMDSNASKPSRLSLKEALVLGLALSVNNVGMGIGASISGLELIPTCVITLMMCIVFLSAGNHIGKIRMFRFAHKFADTASGLILIGLGLYELLV